MATGEPKPPRKLTTAEAEIWDAVSTLPWVGASDSFALFHLAELWGLTRKAATALAKDPSDKNTRVQYLALLREFNTLSGKFGLHPRGRDDMPQGEKVVNLDDKRFFGVTG